MKTERFVFCQFCDDIRQEINGKITLVGVYQGGLQISTPLPTVIPMLAIACSIWTPKDRPFTHLKVGLKLGDVALMEKEFSTQEMTQLLAQSPTTDDSTGSVFNLQLNMAGLPVTKAGMLTMYCKTDDEELRSNSLAIQTIANQAESP